MLYPLSYWSFSVAAPTTGSARDSGIITAEPDPLKRGRRAAIDNDAI